MITVYISIGNSDDKLAQAEWAAFAATVQGAVRRAAAAVHGEWASLPYASFQNACWCVALEPEATSRLRPELASIAGIYRQDSIAWAEAPVTEFIAGASA